MGIVMVTASGEEHGLINSIANSVRDDDFKRFDEKDREAMKKLRKEESRIVKARYINHRGQNERLDKPYCRWAGDPIQLWHLIPNQIYELPIGFINEVNASGLKVRSREDNDRSSINKVESIERIHELVPINF